MFRPDITVMVDGVKNQLSIYVSPVSVTDVLFTSADFAATTASESLSISRSFISFRFLSSDSRVDILLGTNSFTVKIDP